MASTRLTLASVAFGLVATLGSTGCGYRHRYHVVYAYRVPVMVAAPPPMAYAPPPPAMYAPPPPPAAYPGGSGPVVIRTQAAATIVVNPPRPGPTTVQVMPAQQAAPPPAYVPQVQPVQPVQPTVPQQQQDPSWFDNGE